MATTYGQLRMEIAQLAPGKSLDVIDGFLRDRYTEILDRLNWSRLQAQGVITSPVSYSAGTIAVTNGSNAITGTGTAWTAGMTSRIIRINGESDYYGFTYVSGTTATLDRVYTGDTASGLAYRVDQNLYTLPVDARILDSVRCSTLPLPLEEMDAATANATWPSRNVYGTPKYFVRYMDSATDPAVMQIELLPIPEAVLTFPIWYTYDAAPPASSTTNLLFWVRNGALKAGVLADLGVDREYWAVRFEELVQRMQVNEYRRVGPQRLRGTVSEHRARRWMR